jgi:Zn-dependent protease with chaperone function
LISSDVIDYLEDDQIRFLVGHELGHAINDDLMRGKGFLLANKSLFERKILELALEEPGYWGGYIWDMQLERQFQADDVGIEVSSPKAALDTLVAMMIIAGPNHPGFKFVRMRIQRIIRKYEVYE